MTNWMEIVEFVEDSHPECMRIEPKDVFDPCIVGVGQRLHDVFVVYDRDMVISALATRFSEIEDDPMMAAIEWFDYKVAQAWVGDGTPGFMIR